MQGWISDTWIDGPTFVPKKWLIFTDLGQGLSQKVYFFLIFYAILRAVFWCVFFDKMLALSTKKSTVVLVSVFFVVVFFTTLFKYFLKGRP